MVDGHKDLQTKLPDFITSSLCLWTGVELGLSQHLTTWRLLPAHRVRMAPGPLDLRFYVLGPFLFPIIVLSVAFWPPTWRDCLNISHPCSPSQEG